MPLKVRTELSKLFRAMIEVRTDDQIWEKATALAWSLDRQGKVLPLTDVIIAACALSQEAAVVTTDTHFNQIPGLTVYSDLP